MKVGAFELKEPLPDLRNLDALVALSPWIDVGSVGTSVLSLLESQCNAKDMGQLSRPGLFYDFTRYRPQIHFSESGREIEIPNTTIRYATREQESDLLFFHCLEPHMLGETFAESILKVMRKLNVRRYWTIGSMYDSVPHTRPLLVSGIASGDEMRRYLSINGVEHSEYQGPTTISLLASENAPKHGIETIVLIVRLPYYAQIEEDHSGQYRLLSLLSPLLNLSIPLDQIKRKGNEQYGRVSMAVEGDTRIKEMLEVLEMGYDSETGEKHKRSMSSLSPEIEKFLRHINKDFD